MKFIQFFLVVTVIAASVAFPTPQEVKSVSKTKQQDEHVPMVQRIEIHVEVMADPGMKLPAMVTVTEVKEHLEKSTEAVKAVHTDKVPEVVNTADVKSLESVESSELVKSVEVTKLMQLVKPTVDTKETEAIKEEADVKKVGITDEAAAKDEEIMPVITSVPKEADQLVEATSEPKAAIVDAPMVTSVEQEPEKVETKAETVNPVQVDANAAEKVQTKADDDSDEDDSSEEKSTTEMMMMVPGEPVRASPVITFDEAVKETSMEPIKAQATTVIPEVQAEEATKVVEEEKSVEPKPEAKSITNEKVVPIVEELPVEKQSVEAEPVYRTIPVAVVHDEPVKEEIREVTLKTVETVSVVEQKKVEIPTANPAEATTVMTDVEKPTVQDEVEATTAGQVQDEHIPNVKAVDAVMTAAGPVTVASTRAGTVEATSEKLEEPNVLVVEAIKAVEEKDSELIVQTTTEPTKETEVKVIEAVKDEGSSTKAVTSESAEKKVDDSSVSSSTAKRSTEDSPKASEVTEKAEEVTTEEATTTTTTTTTSAPVKVEGKKGKKKLPGSNKKQNTI